METASKPHVVFIPVPAQSHIKCMLKLARLLHHKGLHITFVNTEFNHKQLLNSGGPHSLDGEPGFRFETIPDGIPDDSRGDRYAIPKAVLVNFLAPFLDLLARLENPATCIIADGMMPFAVDAAETLKVPIIQFWTFAASAFMGYYQTPILIEKRLIPLKDESCLTNGYLETIIDGIIPGLESFRLKDLPGHIRTTDSNDVEYNFANECAKATRKVSAIITHTVEELEPTVIKALKPMFTNVYTIGPLELLIQNEQETNNYKLGIEGYSLWKEDVECLNWLQSKEPSSVVYVNFGSLIVMSSQQLLEFGWGLANSNHFFLWIMRPGLVVGESLVFPPELQGMINKRGFIASWCPQEQVLNHPSVGGFLTHCGWGSTIESLSAGVPMMCWPYLWDQLTNCRLICKEWKVGMEIGDEVKRDKVEKLTRELIGGDEGKQMRSNALDLKKKIEIATGPNGSSSLNVEKLANHIQMFSRN